MLGPDVALEWTQRTTVANTFDRITHRDAPAAPEPDNLTDSQRDWLFHSEALWREAHAIATANPGMDAGDVYHSLRCLELTPSQRLGRGLTRVRHRPHLG